MIVALEVLLLVTSVLLIVLVLLHKGKGGGLSDLFGGGVSTSIGGSSVAVFALCAPTDKGMPNNHKSNNARLCTRFDMARF